MSGPELISTLRATDYDLTAVLRFLDAFARHSISHNSFSSSDLRHHFVPRFDCEEHEQVYELYGELPGFDKENITIEANDDRNIQISGWIPRRHGATTTSSLGTDPTVQVQHHDVPQGHHHEAHMERFGEILNPNREPPSDSPAVERSPKPADPSSTSQPKTPPNHKPDTARFGDVLDPNAQFAHRPMRDGSGKPKVKYLTAERQYGHFHRAFHFPSPIKKDEVSARMDNGILHITAPKAVVLPPTKIEIKKVTNT